MTVGRKLEEDDAIVEEEKREICGRVPKRL
jgi:hypothetical protein